MHAHQTLASARTEARWGWVLSVSPDPGPRSADSLPLGIIVLSHCSSSLEHHSCSLPLLSSAAYVFGCALPPSLNRNIEMASWLLRAKRIKRRCLCELAQEALIKQQRVMNRLCGMLFPAVFVEYSHFHCGWRDSNDPCPLSIHLLPSFLVQNAANYSHAALILMKAARGSTESPARDLGGRIISPKFPAKPSGRWGKDLCVPVITSASHWWHWRWNPPVNPFPRHGEAMFVYIDPQHMWPSCCRQRLSLAAARSRFPLATVQLASRGASSTHLTNQYKQWGSKSRIMLERPQTEGRIKLLRMLCSGTSLFWELANRAPQLLYCSILPSLCLSMAINTGSVV